MDMNDRALRAININTKGVAKDFPREDGFDITVASEAVSYTHLTLPTNREV